MERRPKAQPAGVVREHFVERRWQGNIDRTISCPMPSCKYTITIIKPADGDKTAALFGINSETWYEKSWWESHRGKITEDDIVASWTDLFHSHVREHGTAALVAEIVRRQDESLAWNASAQRYSDFLNWIAENFSADGLNALIAEFKRLINIDMEPISRPEELFRMLPLEGEGRP